MKIKFYMVLSLAALPLGACTNIPNPNTFADLTCNDIVAVYNNTQPGLAQLATPRALTSYADSLDKKGKPRDTPDDYTVIKNYELKDHQYKIDLMAAHKANECK